MRKKIISLLLAGTMIMGMTACGDDPDAKQYALIENNATEETTSRGESAWSAIEAFATEQETNGGRYTPEGTELENYTDAIDKAVEEGAKIVVCIGDEMSVAVYEAQKDHKNTKFVLMEAQPHKRNSDTENMRKNTCSIYFDELSEGFLAGYAAVAVGDRNIGYMGAEKDERENGMLAAYIQGAEAAATDYNLTEGSVQLRYTFVGDDKLSPAHMGTALDWYKDNCEVIFAPDENLELSVAKAAENQNKKVICAGDDRSSLSTAVLTSAIKDYAGAVRQVLSDYVADEFPGEQTLTYGAKEGAVSLVWSDTDFGGFTTDYYNAIRQKLASGEITVTDTMPSTTYVVATEV